jgi:hypothetical protein
VLWNRLWTPRVGVEKVGGRRRWVGEERGTLPSPPKQQITPPPLTHIPPERRIRPPRHFWCGRSSRSFNARASRLVHRVQCVRDHWQQRALDSRARAIVREKGGVASSTSRKFCRSGGRAPARAAGATFPPARTGDSHQFQCCKWVSYSVPNGDDARARGAGLWQCSFDWPFGGRRRRDRWA